MPFVTGTAISMADLMTALRTACTANGWTLSGNVLSKGGCYVQTRILACPAPSTRPSIGTRDYMMVRAGNGIDGSNNLTDPAGNEPCIGPFTNTGNSSSLEYIDWAFPATYRIHVNTNPDEVWMAVRYNNVFYQHIGFGKTPGVGNPGTGNWHFATMPNLAATSNNETYKYQNKVNSGAGPFGVGSFQNGNVCPQPFWIGGRVNGAGSETAGPGLVNYSYHGMRGDTGAASWSASGNGFNVVYTAPGAGTSCQPTIVPLLERQPNAWNNEAILLPLQLLIRRPSNKTSIQAEFKHLRTLRMDFLDPEHIIDLAPDKWCVYPCLQKNTSLPGGGLTQLMHSGCFAIAVRYDGP